ncbi:MAG: hypothetical protein ACJ74W_05505 [Pyrinomonadaceae bacterium]
MQIRDSEYELESEWETGLHEGPQGEAFLGDLVKGVGSLLGLGEGEGEWEGGALGESEFELEGPLGEGPMPEGPLGEGYAYGEGPLGESFAYGEGPQHEGYAYGEGPLPEGPLGEGYAYGEGFAYGEGPQGEGYAYGEGPQQEQFLGGLGEGEYEAGGLGEYEGEYESEQFFGKLLRRVPGLIKRVAPVLRNVAKAALPIVTQAVGGPLGGQIANVAGSLLGEGELEGEWEGEGEWEVVGEAPMHEAPLTHQQALGELMAAVASKAQTDAEAEAMIGAATIITLSPADRAALRRILPALVRGTAILTRILRRRRITRPAIRSVPAIVRRTANTLQRRAAAGQPITKRSAARAMAVQTKKVLASPRTCSHDIQRNLRATRAVARTSRPSRPRPRGSAI